MSGFLMWMGLTSAVNLYIRLSVPDTYKTARRTGAFTAEVEPIVYRILTDNAKKTDKYFSHIISL